jgi:hypothetical protein
LKIFSEGLYEDTRSRSSPPDKEVPKKHQNILMRHIQPRPSSKRKTELFQGADFLKHHVLLGEIVFAPIVVVVEVVT